MTCSLCKLTIGSYIEVCHPQNTFGCEACNAQTSLPPLLGIYRGKQDDKHLIEAHTPVVCSSCGRSTTMLWSYCEDEGERVQLPIKKELKIG